MLYSVVTVFSSPLFGDIPHSLTLCGITVVIIFISYPGLLVAGVAVINIAGRLADIGEVNPGIKLFLLRCFHFWHKDCPLESSVSLLIRLTLVNRVLLKITLAVIAVGIGLPCNSQIPENSRSR